MSSTTQGCAGRQRITSCTQSDYRAVVHAARQSHCSRSPAALLQHRPPMVCLQPRFSCHHAFVHVYWIYRQLRSGGVLRQSLRSDGRSSGGFFCEQDVPWLQHQSFSSAQRFPSFTPSRKAFKTTATPAAATPAAPAAMCTPAYRAGLHTHLSTSNNNAHTPSRVAFHHTPPCRFQLIGVLIASPVALLVALWGMQNSALDHRATSTELDVVYSSSGKAIHPPRCVREMRE